MAFGIRHLGIQAEVQQCLQFRNGDKKLKTSKKPNNFLSVSSLRYAFEERSNFWGCFKLAPPCILLFICIFYPYTFVFPLLLSLLGVFFFDDDNGFSLCIGARESLKKPNFCFSLIGRLQSPFAFSISFSMHNNFTKE